VTNLQHVVKISQLCLKQGNNKAIKARMILNCTVTMELWNLNGTFFWA